MDLKQYIRDCIAELCVRYKSHSKEFMYESDIHSDLYVILNMKDKNMWNKFCVMMGSEDNFKGTDLVIYSPSNIRERVHLEVKYSVENSAIELDLQRLKTKRSQKMFLYLEWQHEDHNVVAKILEEFSVKYPTIEILYFHIKQNTLFSFIGGNIQETSIPLMEELKLTNAGKIAGL